MTPSSQATSSISSSELSSAWLPSLCEQAVFVPATAPASQATFNISSSLPSDDDSG